jgi:hypothetical protein
MRLPFRAAAVSLVLAATACVSGGQPTAGTLGGRNRSEISVDEVLASKWRTAYEVVHALRPDWLRKRSSTPSVGNSRASSVPDDVIVYRDGQRLGTIETLRSIPVGDVSRMRHYSAAGAQQRFGTGNPNGAIEVLTR